MSKLIVLDAGHGRNTPGKRCLKFLDPCQTREWQLNSRIADRTGVLLACYGCRVLRADDITGCRDVGLSERVKAANAAGADMYISIHHNAGLNGRSGGGTEVYYYSNAPERAAQARRLYDAVVSRTGLTGNRSSRIIKKGFYVIKRTSMPAFLIENGFMDSPADVPVILGREHAEKTAEGIAAFLAAELGLHKTGSGTVPEASAGDSTGTGGRSFPSVPFSVRVLADDLNYRSAPSMDGEIRGDTGKGVFTVVEVQGNWGKLKSGAGWIYLGNPAYYTILG